MAGSVRAPSGQVEPTGYYEPAAPPPPKAEAVDASQAKKSKNPKNQEGREETPERGSNSSGGQSPSEVRFKVEEGVKNPVIQLVDAETGEVRSQFPAEDAVKAAQKLGAVAGLFFEREG